MNNPDFYQLAANHIVNIDELYLVTKIFAELADVGMFPADEMKQYLVDRHSANPISDKVIRACKQELNDYIRERDRAYWEYTQKQIIPIIFEETSKLTEFLQGFFEQIESLSGSYRQVYGVSSGLSTYRNYVFKHHLFRSLVLGATLFDATEYYRHVQQRLSTLTQHTESQSYSHAILVYIWVLKHDPESLKLLQANVNEYNTSSWIIRAITEE